MAKIIVDIDPHSGFCFGVTKAIESADELLNHGEKVFCVGDIVHNEAEALRLKKAGMQTISMDEVQYVNGGIVLFRAHGESPSSYQQIIDHKLTLKDSTCPVVIKLQQRVKAAWIEQKKHNGQIVIFGKKEHPEIKGLVGQTNGEAIVVESDLDLQQLDFNRPIELFSQTTKSPELLKNLIERINERALEGCLVVTHDTTCRQVTGRVPRIKSFAAQYDLVIFVGGTKSSNAQVLFEACKSANSFSYFITGSDEVNGQWFTPLVSRIGVCGATSTPMWLMEQVAAKVDSFFT